MGLKEIFISGGLFSWLLSLAAFCGLIAYVFTIDLQRSTAGALKNRALPQDMKGRYLRWAHQNSLPVAMVKQVSSFAPGIGLMGTAYGLSMAMATLKSGFPDPGELASSMSTALGTTLAGLGIWLLYGMFHFHLVMNGRRINLMIAEGR